MSEFVKPKTVFASDAEYIQNLVNANLKKDLHDNEEICQHCHGTGMAVVDNRYGLSDDPDKIGGHFPYIVEKHNGERFHFYSVISETVGEYTGLHDKNGNKIFEGDIVFFEDESPSNYEYHDCTEMRCGVIEYGDNCFYVTNRIAVEMEDLIYDGKLDVEVIGNIHDNPELLKGE